MGLACLSGMPLQLVAVRGDGVDASRGKVVRSMGGMVELKIKMSWMEQVRVMTRVKIEVGR